MRIAWTSWPLGPAPLAHIRTGNVSRFMLRLFSQKNMPSSRRTATTANTAMTAMTATQVCVDVQPIPGAYGRQLERLALPFPGSGSQPTC